MDMKKWKDWRLNALNSLDEQKNPVDESFHRLNREAKLVVSLREMRKRLIEIETLFNKTVESGKMDETTVNNWTNTYKSLKQLDERLHKLMECMYKK